MEIARTGPSRRFTFHDGFTPLVFSARGILGLFEGPGESQHLGRWGGPPEPGSIPNSSLRN